VIQLIGGEMPGWAEPRPPAGGGLLSYLTAQLPAGATVLVAGPHDDTLIDALAARTSVTCLVRSQPAADELDARGLDVLCGTLPKVAPDRQWDVVVALDGLDRLCSAEGPQLGWAESLQVLRRALRPGGTLLLAVENELGVHRLVDPGTATAAQTDDAWQPLGEFDETRPGSPARLTAHLTAEGLAVDWLGAAWPTPGSPTFAATREALDGPAALDAVAAGAIGHAYADRFVLSDPRRLAGAAVRGGLGPELAPSWLVVAHLAADQTTARMQPPGESTPPGESKPIAPPLPPVLLGDGPPTTAIPAGRLLEELLLGACLRDDRPALRRLLTGWVAALPDVAATDVVVDGDTYTALHGRVPAAGDVLGGFARTLLTGGYAHPWPATTDLQTLTAILHGVAGRPGDVPARPTGDDPPAPVGRREYEEQLRARDRELADAAARAQWYERELAKRDDELRKARAQIATFSGSFGYRTAKLGYKALRKARNRLRKRT
jgi:hypothetical protein